MLQLHRRQQRLGRYFIPKEQILNVRKVTAALHHTEALPKGMVRPCVISLILKTDKASQFISEYYRQTLKYEKCSFLSYDWNRFEKVTKPLLTSSCLV